MTRALLPVNQFDEVGEPRCYYVEDRHVQEMIDEYYVTAQTRRAWGLGKPGDTTIGGKKKKVDLNADADQFRPEHLSDEELQLLMWEHARDKEGMDPAFYRAMMDPNIRLPPELLELTEENDDGTFTNVAQEGAAELIEGAPQKSTEEIKQELRAAVEDTLLLFEVGSQAPLQQLNAHMPSLFISVVQNCGRRACDDEPSPAPHPPGWGRDWLPTHRGRPAGSGAGCNKQPAQGGV